MTTYQVGIRLKIFGHDIVAIDVSIMCDCRYQLGHEYSLKYIIYEIIYRSVANIHISRGQIDHLTGDQMILQFTLHGKEHSG